MGFNCRHPRHRQYSAISILCFPSMRTAFIQLASFRNTSRSLRQWGQGIVTSNVLELRGVSSMAFIQSHSHLDMTRVRSLLFRGYRSNSYCSQYLQLIRSPASHSSQSFHHNRPNHLPFWSRMMMRTMRSGRRSPCARKWGKLGIYRSFLLLYSCSRSSLSPVEDRRSVWMHSWTDPPIEGMGLEYNIVPVGEVKASGALPHHPHHLPPAITSPPQPPAFKIL